MKHSTEKREGKKREYIRTLGNRVWCEIHGDEEYFIEKLHPDLKGKMYADLVAKCGFIICTFSMT